MHSFSSSSPSSVGSSLSRAESKVGKKVVLWNSELHSQHSKTHIWKKEREKKDNANDSNIFNQRHTAFQKALILFSDIKRTLNNSDYYLEAQFFFVRCYSSLFVDWLKLNTTRRFCISRSPSLANFTIVSWSCCCLLFIHIFRSTDHTLAVSHNSK